MHSEEIFGTLNRKLEKRVVNSVRAFSLCHQRFIPLSQFKLRRKTTNSRLWAKVTDSVFLEGLITMATKSKRVTFVVETKPKVVELLVPRFVFKTLVELLAFADANRRDKETVSTDMQNTLSSWTHLFSLFMYSQSMSLVPVTFLRFQKLLLLKM